MDRMFFAAHPVRLEGETIFRDESGKIK